MDRALRFRIDLVPPLWAGSGSGTNAMGRGKLLSRVAGGGAFKKFGGVVRLRQVDAHRRLDLDGEQENVSPTLAGSGAIPDGL